MIPLTPCQSSQLASFGYDAASRVLAIRFKHGEKVYHYRDVSPEVADGLASAESKGKFFGAEIRNKFDFEAVVDEPAEEKA